jgi:hypothetical protein
LQFGIGAHVCVTLEARAGTSHETKKLITDISVPEQQQSPVSMSLHSADWGGVGGGKHTPWPESASELYQPSAQLDSEVSANLCGKLVPRGQIDESYNRNLGL